MPYVPLEQHMAKPERCYIFYPLKVMLYVPLEQHMAKPERCYIVLYFFR
jgi:hypothetical protein